MNYKEKRKCRCGNVYEYGQQKQHFYIDTWYFGCVDCHNKYKKEGD